MTADLSALIARLEAAEVGGRELDGEIEEIFDLWRASFTEPEKADGRHCWTDLATWSGEGVVHSAPPYTTSLDAALALAERVLGNGPCVLHRNGPSEWGFTYVDDDTAYAATPALSVCAAILRAKQGEG